VPTVVLLSARSCSIPATFLELPAASPRHHRRANEARRQALLRERIGEDTAGFLLPVDGECQLLADLARQPYSRDAWWQRAAGIVQVLGEVTQSTALSCMVHWPSPPEGVRPADAAFRMQVASAYVLARGGHRDALVAILHGPVDWTGTAALVGLTELAVREDDNAAAELVLATALDDEINPIRWQCLIEPAILLSPLLRGVAPETAERIAARRKEAEEAS
jgi:hypothetical protein